MNNLAKLTDNTPMILARKTAREFELTNRAEAGELLYIYSQCEQKDIHVVLDELKRCIKTYEGLVRIKASRGEREESVERSLEMWHKDVAQIEKALAMVNTPKGVH